MKKKYYIPNNNFDGFAYQSVDLDGIDPDQAYYEDTLEVLQRQRSAQGGKVNTSSKSQWDIDVAMSNKEFLRKQTTLKSGLLAVRKDPAQGIDLAGGGGQQEVDESPMLGRGVKPGRDFNTKDGKYEVQEISTKKLLYSGGFNTDKSGKRLRLCSHDSPAIYSNKNFARETAEILDYEILKTDQDETEFINPVGGKREKKGLRQMRTVLKGLTHDLAGTKIIKGDKNWQSVVDKDVANKIMEQTLPNKDPNQLEEFKDNVLNLLKHKENLTLELGKRQFMMKGHDQLIIDNKMGDIKMMENVYKELHLKEAREMRNEDNIKNATSLGQNKEKNIFYLKRKSKKVNLSEMFKDPREQITQIELRRAIKDRHQKYFNRSMWCNENVGHIKSRAKGFADIVIGNLYASLVEPEAQVKNRDADIAGKTNFRKGFILNGDENHTRFGVEGDDVASGEGSKFDARSLMRSPLPGEFGLAPRTKPSKKMSSDRSMGRVGSVCLKPGRDAFGIVRERTSDNVSYSNLAIVPENHKYQLGSSLMKGTPNLNFTVVVKPEDNQCTAFQARLKNTKKQTL
jgi:hypothetical protein